MQLTKRKDKEKNPKQRKKGHKIESTTLYGGKITRLQTSKHFGHIETQEHRWKKR